MRKITVIKERKARIKEANFKKNQLHLIFDDRQEVFFSKDEGFLENLLSTVRCASIEELMGKEVIYYVVIKEQTRIFVVENPNYKSVVYTPMFKEKD